MSPLAGHRHASFVRSSPTFGRCSRSNSCARLRESTVGLESHDQVRPSRRFTVGCARRLRPWTPIAVSPTRSRPLIGSCLTSSPQLQRSRAALADDALAHVGGRLATGLRDVTTDLLALDGPGFWVV